MTENKTATVDELLALLKRLSEEGKGHFRVGCEEYGISCYQPAITVHNSGNDGYIQFNGRV